MLQATLFHPAHLRGYRVAAAAAIEPDTPPDPAKDSAPKSKKPKRKRADGAGDGDGDQGDEGGEDAAAGGPIRAYQHQFFDTVAAAAKGGRKGAAAAVPWLFARYANPERERERESVTDRPQEDGLAHRGRYPSCASCWLGSAFQTKLNLTPSPEPGTRRRRGRRTTGRRRPRPLRRTRAARTAAAAAVRSLGDAKR